MTHASSLLAPALDPIFAVIAEHRAAWEASNRASLASGRISGDAPEYDAALELVFRLIHLVPAAMCSSSACLPRAFFSSVPTHSFGTRGDVFFQRLPAACILL
jgi:hypothetical protein